MARIRRDERGIVGVFLLLAVGCGGRDAARTWDGSDGSDTPPLLPTDDAALNGDEPGSGEMQPARPVTPGAGGAQSTTPATSGAGAPQTPGQAGAPEPTSEVVCQEDEMRCNGAELQICDRDRRSFRVRETCQSACDCYVGIRPEFSGCEASSPSCVAGSFSCDEDRLLVCRETGGCDNEFVLLRQCRHAIACIAGLPFGTCVQ